MTNGELSTLLYCHDTFGLGHLRRTLLLAHHLRSRWPAASQLLVTGSPLAHAFELPDGADYVKLPSVVKVGAGRYEPAVLPVSFADVRGLRRDVLTATALRFRPDVCIVDNVPAGLEGELVPALRHLKRASPNTRLVLGLRDILDDPARLCAEWNRQGVYELLDDVYDLIVVYGDASIFDVVSQYRLSSRAAAKTRYVGYLPRRARPARVDEVRAELGGERPLVLGTVGGGGDGYRVLHALLEARRRWPATADFDCVVAVGPFAPPEERRTLVRMAADGARARVLDFDSELTAYMAAADVVVSMAGYNSVCELVSLRRPVVLVPRVEPRLEQLIRARAVTRLGAGRMIHPAELTPRRMLDEVNRLLRRPPGAVAALPMTGLTRLSEELEAVLASRSGTARAREARKVA